MRKAEKTHTTFELQPPDGGWGYLVVAALTLSFNVTVIPMTCFGLIFGNFLATIGDETTGTTLANGIFNTVLNFTGLAANHLLQRYSFRFVGIIGALLFFLGNFSTVFATNLPQLLISFGVIQGIGMGLVFPAMFTAFNSYFDKKQNFMNGIAQTLMVAASMIFPVIGRFLMDSYGYRGTLAILAALSLNGVLAAAILQPVEWHLKKVPISINSEEPQLKPLLELKVEDGVTESYKLPKQRTSIISIGDRAMSVTTINHLGRIHDRTRKSLWKSLVKSLDLGMFKDPVYVNIALGLSLGFTADVAFIAIIPLVLMNAGFDNGQITLMMTVYFGSDLVARIILSIISALCKVNNRLVFLGGAFLTAIFRIAFVSGNSFIWKLSTISALGFMRCFIQTPLPLVIADEYSDNFATAFSLYMVVCGFISLLFGPLMSFVKSWTHSDVMVVHVLTAAYLVCVMSWTTEIVYKRLLGKKTVASK